MLSLYARRRKWGYVQSNDAGVILERNPDTVYGPDVAFFGGSLRYQDANPKINEDIPLLVVEVWSPTDRPGKMRRRVARYLKSGVRMVWVIDPEERDVTVWAGGTDVVLDVTQEIDGDEVLPDFRAAVAEFFWTPDNEDEAGKE
jgi:Uma2 family endonuclease